MDLLSAPAVTWIDPVANGATLNAAAVEPAIAPVVDTEADKTGVVVGAAAATLAPEGGEVQLGVTILACARWVPLPSANDRLKQRLMVTLAILNQPNQKIEGNHAAESSNAPGNSLPDKANIVYLPLMASGSIDASLDVLPDDAIYVLASSTSGPQGDYGATSLTAVNDYHVGLYTAVGEDL